MARFWLVLTVSFVFVGISMISGGLLADLGCTSVNDAGVPGDTGLGGFYCTVLKNSKCTKGIPCGGFHNPGGEHCTLEPDGTISGSCIKCEGTQSGDFCKATKDSKCNVADRFFGGPGRVNCGNEVAANCVVDPTAPFGAKCSLFPSGPVGYNDCQGLRQCE